jgi:penicillin-binding protein 1A
MGRRRLQPRSRPAAKPRRRVRPRGRRGRRRGSWWGGVARLTLACLFLYAAVAGFYYVLALRYNLLELHHLPERTVVYAADGKVLGRFSGENRVVISLEDVPEHFVTALLAREDHRFYQHVGVDPVGIVRAMVRNVLLGGIRQGGSTITQQLARNSFPLGGRNFHRKLLEAALSFRIETEVSKEEILESYINRIYFGSGCYGLETASQTYFGKPASRLTLSESALLAGLIRSPTRLSPLNDSEASLRQRDSVLARLGQLGWMEEADLQAARSEPLRLNPGPRIFSAENWAMEMVRREMEPILRRLGLDAGGLQIYTTIDASLQQTVQQRLAQRLQEIETRSGYTHPSRAVAVESGSPHYLQAAVVVLDHRSGAVLSIAGGRDFTTSKFHRALLGRRQVGSLVKPFVYAHALRQGVDPRSRVSDERLRTEELPAAHRAYDPTNPDGEYQNNRPISDVVVFSRNPMTVRLALRAGLPGLAAMLEQAGVAQSPPVMPSLALGAFESNLRDLTAAMTVFPNGGHMVQPFVIREIAEAGGRVLYRQREVRKPLLEPKVANQVWSAMQEVMTRGTGAGSRRLGLRGPAGGKTGTTNDSVDAWFIGSLGKMTAGVWVGFDQPRTILPGAGGAQLALPLWVDVVSSPPAAPYR